MYNSIINYLYIPLIRVLVFSPLPISQVTVSINNGDHATATPTGNALYTLPWEPSKYSSGLHTITVFVKVICISDKYITFHPPIDVFIKCVYDDFFSRILRATLKQFISISV